MGTEATSEEQRQGQGDRFHGGLRNCRSAGRVTSIAWTADDGVQEGGRGASDYFETLGGEYSEPSTVGSGATAPTRSENALMSAIAWGENANSVESSCPRTWGAASMLRRSSMLTDVLTVSRIRPPATGAS